MDCEAYILLMSAALDGECTAEERRTLDSHLAVCPQCAALYEQMAAQTAALRELDCEMPADLKDRILSNLPAQEQPAKKGKLIRWKQWVPVAAAACLVLVVALLPKSPRAGSAAPAANASNTSIIAKDGSVSEVAYGHSSGSADKAETQAPAATVPGATSVPGAMFPAAGAPDFYGYGNPQVIRVSWGATPAAPSALVIGSAEELEAYLAQFSSQSYDGEGNPLPMEELEKLKLVYTADYFTGHRLLCVVVESGSGSDRFELASQGLKRDTVTVVRHTPEVGTCDMAAWLLTAEVDTMFSGGDTLEVQFVEG